MHPVILAAFVDELEKIAASLQQLSAGVGRLEREGAIAHIDTPFTKMLGAFTTPNKRQLAGAGAPVMQKFQKKLLGPGVHEYISSQAAPFTTPEFRGKIILSPNPGAVLNPTATGSTLEGLNAYTTMHEALEREGSLGQGLHSLGTELNDFSLASRLSGGPTEDAVRESVLELRKPEIDHLRKKMVKEYGPAAAGYIQEGSKPTRAMRRNWGRKLLAKPSAYMTAGEGKGIMAKQIPILNSRQPQVSPPGAMIQKHQDEGGKVVRGIFE